MKYVIILILNFITTNSYCQDSILNIDSTKVENWVLTELIKNREQFKLLNNEILNYKSSSKKFKKLNDLYRYQFLKYDSLIYDLNKQDSINKIIINNNNIRYIRLEKITKNCTKSLSENDKKIYKLNNLKDNYKFITFSLGFTTLLLSTLILFK